MRTFRDRLKEDMKNKEFREAFEEEEVLKYLTNELGVDESYMVYGVYDLVAKISADSMKNLKDTVINNIRQAKGVRSTLTMVIVRD